MGPGAGRPRRGRRRRGRPLRLCETLAGVADGSDVEVGLPTPAQAAVVSPGSSGLRCAGPSRASCSRVSPHRGRVKLRTELVDLAVHPDGAERSARSRRGTRTVQAHYVVAADGADSTVRGRDQHPDARLDGRAGGSPGLFRAPLWATLGEHRYGLYWTERPRAGGCSSRRGRVIGGSTAASGIRQSPRSRRGRLRGTDSPVGRAPELPLEIEHVGSFSSMAAQLAEQFRHERVFLVGDAAHRVTPRGGTRMSTAVHDGYDLGVEARLGRQGLGREDLLEATSGSAVRWRGTTSRIRDLQARRAAEDDTRRPGRPCRPPTGSALAGPHLDPRRAQARAHAVDRPGRRRVGEAADTASSDPPVATHAFDTITARALGIVGDGALLVRPDGAPVAFLPAGASRRSRLQGAIAGVSTFGRDPASAAAA